MPAWSEYKEIAEGRGALAFELFIVESTLVVPVPEMQAHLPDHLAYQKEMEKAGKLFLAGPLSDAAGEQTSGCGMIVYRVSSMEEARTVCDNDPMHKSGARTYTIRRWLVNEGSLSLNLGLSEKSMRFL
jgi:uncharacterized protein YciI